MDLFTSARVEELEKLITGYQNSYYNGEAEISDAEFDALWDELKKLDPESSSETQLQTSSSAEPESSDAVPESSSSDASEVSSSDAVNSSSSETASSSSDQAESSSSANWAYSSQSVAK